MIHTKRRPQVAYLQFEVFALPTQSNKQQETYADMTTRYTDCRCSMDIVIPIGIYCYFGFVLLVESCEVSVSKTQSAINAI